MKNSIAQTWARQYIAREKVRSENEAERRHLQAQLETENAKRLAEFDDEISTLEIQAAADCDENLFVKLAAKQKMRPHFDAKLKTESEKRLAEFKPDKELPEISADYSFEQIIADAETEMRASFRKYFRHEAMAIRVGNDSDAGAIFRRWNTYPVSESERLEIIRATARGESLPWIFS